MTKIYLLASLILQTMQQLLDVYGQSVDKVITGNTNNIVFLKSTDTDMISTLSKMSGTRHEAITSKTITQDNANIFERNDARITKGVNLQEVAVITENDFITLPPRNSIIFRAGATPVWNRNEMILPMSYALLGNTIIQAGIEPYTLQTLPSNAAHSRFDADKNIPDFFEMLRKRCEQARMTKAVERDWLKANGYGTEDLNHTAMYTAYTPDGETLSRDIMAEINQRIAIRHGDRIVDQSVLKQYMTDNDEFSKAHNHESAKVAQKHAKIFANNRVSRAELINGDKVCVSDTLRRVFAQALMLAKVRQDLAKVDDLLVRDDGIFGPNNEPFAIPDERTWSALEIDQRTFAFDDLTRIPDDMIAYTVEDAFIYHLAMLEDWHKYGSFNQVVSDLVDKDMSDAYANDETNDIHRNIRQEYGA